MREIIILLLLIVTTAIFKLWGALLITTLWLGFILIVLNSNYYSRLNRFFESVF
ncbi:hypothetical protein GJV85_13370 (plasmid) [Sulfurimonas aquatica]|uniref:Uncharacterized protein n=1 Tax=Sulfurimonas aquatica TaxID=2672570 RepID=A0A975GDY4_9BACT|nr:hypothetical protein [Sulfurimonas aquatica]QSZ43160.1 hypothetical protein GJV85_13370 [Sulfurimonas aquatica]